MALGQLAGRGALALGLLLLVRELPREDFGNLALVLALVQTVATVADAGFARVLVRDVARSRADKGAVVRRLLFVRARALLPVVAGSVLLLLIIPTPLTAGLAALALVYLGCESLSYGFENAAIGIERPWRFVAAQALGGAALLGGLAALAVADAVTLGRALGVLAAASALKLLGHLTAWHRTLAARPLLTLAPARELYRQALPFLGLAVLATLYYRAGVIALHGVRGADETASYGAAVRVLDVVAIGAGIAYAAVAPAWSRTHAARPDAVWRLWLRMVRRAAAVVIPAAVLLAASAPIIARVLFGAEYEHSAGADLRVLAPGAALMVLQAITAAVVFMGDERRSVVWLTGVNVLACVAASIALSAAFGSTGAALALTLSELLSFLTFAVLIRRRYRRPDAPGAAAADHVRPAMPR